MSAEKTTNRRYSTYSSAVQGASQAEGDQVMDVGESVPLSNWQGHFEMSATPGSGTAKIYGVPIGGTEAGKVLLAEVDLTSTDSLALIRSWIGVYEKIVVSPSSFDADKTYGFFITAY